MIDVFNISNPHVYFLMWMYWRSVKQQVLQMCTSFLLAKSRSLHTWLCCASSSPPYWSSASSVDWSGWTGQNNRWYLSIRNRFLLLLRIFWKYYNPKYPRNAKVSYITVFTLFFSSFSLEIFVWFVQTDGEPNACRLVKFSHTRHARRQRHWHDQYDWRSPLALVTLNHVTKHMCQ